MTEIEAFQKIVDWFKSRGQSKVDATRQANYSASRTQEIEDSELRILTKSYHDARHARYMSEGEAKTFERIVWWWYGHGGGRAEAKKFVEEYPPGRWHEIEDSYLLELVEAYWKLKHTMRQPTQNAA
jgi:hypothetical protein